MIIDDTKSNRLKMDTLKIKRNEINFNRKNFSYGEIYVEENEKLRRIQWNLQMNNRWFVICQEKSKKIVNKLD